MIQTVPRSIFTGNISNPVIGRRMRTTTQAAGHTCQSQRRTPLLASKILATPPCKKATTTVPVPEWVKCHD
jgi:hypothetical protein